MTDEGFLLVIKKTIDGREVGLWKQQDRSIYRITVQDFEKRRDSSYGLMSNKHRKIDNDTRNEAKAKKMYDAITDGADIQLIKEMWDVWEDFWHVKIKVNKMLRRQKKGEICDSCGQKIVSNPE